MSLIHQWSRISTLRRKYADKQNESLSVEGNESFIRPYRTLTKELLFPATFKHVEISNSSTCLIFPDSHIKTTWDLGAALCISLQAMLIPVNLAFESVSDWWVYLDLAMLVYFTLDILFNFNLAFYELGALITDRRQIAVGYLKGWCFIDVLATIPFDMVMCAGFTCESETSLLLSLKLFRFSKIIRLVRLAKLNKILFMLEDISSSKLVASGFLFFRLAFILIVMAHWIACIWIFIGFHNRDSPYNWLISFKLEDASNIEIYVSALYWSLTTITSVGYGDTRPTNTPETAFVLVAMVVSSVVFAYLLGSITAFIVQQSASEVNHREQVMALNHFMKSRSISIALRGKVKRYLEFVWEMTRNSPIEKTVILPLLSKPLRHEIYVKTRGVIFSCCPVFDAQFSKQITTLSEKLVQQIFAPEDSVFLEGELSSTMYFIQEGRVDIFHMATNSSYKRLTNQQHFGEVAFFSKMPRTASVRSLCFTELFSLERSVMDEVCAESPEALVKLTLLQKELNEGNLRSLGVSCYVCNKPGHVAINCNSVLIINNRDKVAKDWVEGRSKHSKLVNLHQSTKGNFSRKGRRDRRAHGVRTLKKSPIKFKIDEFMQAESLGNLPTTQPKTRPRYSFIIDEDSEHELDIEFFSEGSSLGPAKFRRYAHQTVFMKHFELSSLSEGSSSSSSPSSSCSV